MTDQTLREILNGLDVRASTHIYTSIRIAEAEQAIRAHYLSLLPKKRTVQLIDGLFTNEHEVNGFNDAVDIMRQRIEEKS